MINRAIKYPKPAIANGISYPSIPIFWSNFPTEKATIAPPIAPAKPPNPATDPVAFLGKISDIKLKTFADQPQCPPAASEIRPTANHTFVTWGTKTTGTAKTAHASKPNFLPLFKLDPFFINWDDSHPRKIPKPQEAR